MPHMKVSAACASVHASHALLPLLARPLSLMCPHTQLSLPALLFRCHLLNPVYSYPTFHLQPVRQSTPPRQIQPPSAEILDCMHDPVPGLPPPKPPTPQSFSPPPHISQYDVSVHQEVGRFGCGGFPPFVAGQGTKTRCGLSAQ
eukprot:scaffold207694_cov24-Tisochrysis_lutea.AAC.2